MTVVIGRLYARAFIQIAAVMMRRQARTQRPKNEEQSTGNDSIGGRASHPLPSPNTTDDASERRAGRRRQGDGSTVYEG